MAEPPAGYVRVEGTNRTPVPGARRVGPADPAERLSVSVRVRRRPGAPPLPDLTQAAAPAGEGLSREEFAATHGADPADIARIEAFANEHGLTVEETSIPRRTVVLAGTVAQMNEAFRVDLGRYQAGETSYRGREGHVHVPAVLTPVVEGVFGLDNRQQARPLFRRAAGPAQTTQALTPPQVAQLYSFPAGVDTAGQCIGLLEFGGGYHPADITTWFTNLGLTAPTLTDVGVDGATNAPGSDADTEVILDIDVAGSVAQGAPIAVYFAPWTEQGWVDAVTTAVHDATNDPTVISISWGWPEYQTINGLTWTAAAMAAVSATFAEAALLAVTVLAASGDQGSDGQIGDGHAHVIYPTADPGVTSCGGTTIANVAGASFDEVLWNDNGASGGGVSDNFAVPGWQTSAGVPASVNDGSHRGRGVPDVAGNADPNSGYNLIQNGSQTGPIGGTSAVAPLYAGLVALINAYSHHRVGYINPALYQKAAAWGVFRDITSSGTNAYNGAPGYPVGVGWDATTGYGVINGKALLASVSPFHFFTISLEERDNAIANLGFVSERIACFVLPAQARGTVPLHRLLHGNDHFFTTSDAERDNAIANLGYVSEGEACFVYAADPSGTTAFYRLRSTQVPFHFFTTSLDERDNAIANLGFVSEGTACFVLPTMAGGTVPLYRLLHGNDHFFTTSDAERDNAIANLGYVSEGEACFVFPTQAQGTQPLHRLRSTATGEHFYTTSDAERDNAILNLGYVSEGEACFVYAADPSGTTAFYRLRRRDLPLQSAPRAI